MERFGAIPVFVAVVEKGGFSAAATALGISKSAVSKRVNRLEEHLGVRLLHRTTRKLSLTEAGERYYENAVRALDAANKAEDAVTELQGEPSGKLSISSPMSFGRLHLAPMIPKFLARYPKLQLELVMDDKKIDLVAAGLDVAIRSGADGLPDSSLVARKLAPLRHVLCASPGYLEESGVPQTPAELAARNCLLFSYSTDAGEWRFCRGDGKAQTVLVSGNYQVNNSEALVAALKEGMGVGRVPTFVAAPEIRSGQLVAVLPQWQQPEHALYAVYPERAYLPAKVRAFLDFVVESLGGDEPYWDRQASS